MCSFFENFPLGRKSIALLRFSKNFITLKKLRIIIRTLPKGVCYFLSSSGSWKERYLSELVSWRRRGSSLVPLRVCSSEILSEFGPWRCVFDHGVLELSTLCRLYWFESRDTFWRTWKYFLSVQPFSQVKGYFRKWNREEKKLLDLPSKELKKLIPKS